MQQQTKDDLPRYMLPSYFTSQYMKLSSSRSNDFTQKLREWVAAHGMKNAQNKRTPQQIQKDISTASKLANILQKSYITMAQFNVVLQKHLAVLDRTMVGPYHLVVHATHLDDRVNMPLMPKSSAWLARKVINGLSDRHSLQGLLQVVQNQITVQDQKGRAIKDPWVGNSGRNIVYVDDGIYSGMQLSAFFISLCTLLWKARKPAVNNKNLRGGTHLWIMIPYRTYRGQRLLSELESGAFFDYMKEEIMQGEIMENVPDLEHVVASGASIDDIVNTAKRLLTVHVVNLGSDPKYEPIPERKNVYYDLKMTTSDEMGEGLLVFEHKVPDSVSFPSILRKGFQIRNGKFNGSKPKRPFISQTDDKPYGLEQPGLVTHIIGTSNV